MYEAECAPRLAATLPERHMATRMLRMALLPESQVDARMAPIYKQYKDVETTILAGSAEIQLHFVCAKATEAEAQARVDELAEAIEHEMGEAVFSSHGESLEEVVLLMLGLRHMTLAAAESCTGGLLAERLTAVPGSSRYFLGGAVVYADQLKTEFADVPEEMVRTRRAGERAGGAGDGGGDSQADRGDGGSGDYGDCGAGAGCAGAGCGEADWAGVCGGVVCGSEGEGGGAAVDGGPGADSVVGEPACAGDVEKGVAGADVRGLGVRRRLYRGCAKGACPAW